MRRFTSTSIILALTVIANYFTLKTTLPSSPIKLVDFLWLLWDNQSGVIALSIILLFLIPGLTTLIISRLEHRPYTTPLGISLGLLSVISVILAIMYVPQKIQYPDIPLPSPTNLTDRRAYYPQTLLHTPTPNVYQIYAEASKTNSQNLTLKKSTDDSLFGYYLFDSSDQLVIYQPTNVHPGLVSDFWYDAASGTIFMAEMTGHPQAFGIESGFQITKYSPVTNPPKQIVTTINPVMYSVVHFIDYDSQSDRLIFNHAGGDGCGGYGSIYIVDSQITTIDHGQGCANPDSPRFIGYIDHKIILGTIKPNPDTMNYDYNYPFVELNLFDTATKQTTSITNSLPDNLINAKFDPQTRLLQLFSLDSVTPSWEKQL